MTHLSRPHPLAPGAGPSERDPLRIVVVDADDRTRESLVGLLGIRNRFRVVGSAGDVPAALVAVRAQRPDAVVLDPRLPEPAGGMDLIRSIHAIDPAIRVLVVGWSQDLETASRRAGADGFVRKTFRPSELAEAIGRCMEYAEPAPSGIGPGAAPVLE